eukprot:CAMPEP_0117551034 /NCGR_PEP_ID=MMETSP0784-20121206/48983_1 /TAXON_ID=39447 /ORGANISM="" /LENGTH=78 /DNA_ID=CAMNT_0005348061 /DNA_START=483 /DNA_END=715 /DNA_ORIENTATION=+
MNGGGPATNAASPAGDDAWAGPPRDPRPRPRAITKRAPHKAATGPQRLAKIGGATFWLNNCLVTLVLTVHEAVGSERG